MTRFIVPLVVAMLLIAGQNGCNSEEAVLGQGVKAIQATVEMVAGMAEMPPLVETLQFLYTSVTAFPVIEACVNETASLSNFKGKVQTQAQAMSTTAMEAEKTVKDAEAMKAEQGEVARVSSIVWQKLKGLYHQQQAMLIALDKDVKYLIMERAEEIGNSIRNGSSAEWTIAKVKAELMKEMVFVKAIAGSLSAPVKEVVGSVITQVIENVIATQVYSALRMSPLEQSLAQDSEISALYPFTEYAISEGLKRVNNITGKVLTSGHDHAEQYAAFSDNTVNETEAAQAGVSSISVTMPCREVETKATEALNKLKALHTSMQQNELKTAESAKIEVEENEPDVINGVMFAADDGKGGLKSAFEAVLKTFPQEGQRSTGIEEAVTAMAMSDVQPSMSVASLKQLVDAIDPKMDSLGKAYFCFAKILEVIGKIVEGCQEGAGSFDSLYQQVTAQSNIDDDQCSQDAMLQLPSKEDIKTTVESAATKLNYNADCSSSSGQQDFPQKTKKIRMQFQDEDAFFNLGKIFGNIWNKIRKVFQPAGLSTSQKMIICQLRKQSKSDKEIVDLTSICENFTSKCEKLMKGVECPKKKIAPREDL